MEITLRKQLEDYFNNGIYPYVRNTMKENIKQLLNDAETFDSIPDNTSDKIKNDVLDSIYNRLLVIKNANDRFADVFERNR